MHPGPPRRNRDPGRSHRSGRKSRRGVFRGRIRWAPRDFSPPPPPASVMRTKERGARGRMHCPPKIGRPNVPRQSKECRSPGRAHGSLRPECKMYAPEGWRLALGGGGGSYLANTKPGRRKTRPFPQPATIPTHYEIQILRSLERQHQGRFRHHVHRLRRPSSTRPTRSARALKANPAQTPRN